MARLIYCHQGGEQLPYSGGYMEQPKPWVALHLVLKRELNEKERQDLEEEEARRKREQQIAEAKYGNRHA